MAKDLRSNAERDAIKGAAIGTLFGPGVGTVTGGILGLFIGLGKDASEEQDRAAEEEERTQNESARFQAGARAQRLSLLQTGRRFGEESSGSNSSPSALSATTQAKSTSGFTPLAGADKNSSGSNTSGTF
jgi:hypothetical protein